MQTVLGPIGIKTSRNRDGSSQPEFVAERQIRLAGLNDKTVRLSAGGMTTPDFSAYLAELYDLEIGRDTISRVTDAVLEDIAAWWTRPPDRV